VETFFDLLFNGFTNKHSMISQGPILYGSWILLISKKARGKVLFSFLLISETGFGQLIEHPYTELDKTVFLTKLKVINPENFSVVNRKLNNYGMTCLLKKYLDFHLELF